MKIAARNHVVRWEKDARKFIVMKPTAVGAEEIMYTREAAIQKSKLLNARERKISTKLKKAAVSVALDEGTMPS